MRLTRILRIHEEDNGALRIFMIRYGENGTPGPEEELALPVAKIINSTLNLDVPTKITWNFPFPEDSKESQG